MRTGSRQSFQERRQEQKAKLWAGEMDSALDFQEAPHFLVPSARVVMKPRTSRNMATESSTVMTTMPPVRAIPSPMPSTFLPVRRESGVRFVGRRSPYPT